MKAWELDVGGRRVRVESHMGLLDHVLKLRVDGQEVAARTGTRFDPGNRVSARVRGRARERLSLRAAVTWTWTERWLLLEARVWVNGRRVLHERVVSNASAHLRVARAALVHARPA